MRILFRVILVVIMPLLSYANNNIFTFPIDNYAQDNELWFDSKSIHYNEQLLSSDYQQQRLIILKHNYFGTESNDQSPWSEEHFNQVIRSQNSSRNIYSRLLDYLNDFDNTKNKSKVYGVNYQKYTQEWLNSLYKNSNIAQFKNLTYIASNRAIAIDNMPLRAVPTLDPVFYDYRIAGEGYPFDNNALSAVFAGTPLYVLGKSLDQRWLLVMTPDYIGWVEAKNIAYASPEFIKIYQRSAYKKLLGVIKTDLAILDNQNLQVAFSAYVGMIFPVINDTESGYIIMYPKKDLNNHAIIREAIINKLDGVLLPLTFTQANLSRVIEQLKGRPYGWGSMNYYTDCSFEMKSIYTLFGYFLPRNSKHQLEVGKVVDISRLSPQERADYIMRNAKPMLTLIWIKGHIFMYVGTYQDTKGHKFIQTYQQMWGLAPKSRDSRYVVGKSVFFPLLFSYPENKDLVSMLYATNMKLVYLDQMSNDYIKIGINELMY